MASLIRENPNLTLEGIAEAYGCSFRNAQKRLRSLREKFGAACKAELIKSVTQGLQAKFDKRRI